MYLCYHNLLLWTRVTLSLKISYPCWLSHQKEEDLSYLCFRHQHRKLFEIRWKHYKYNGNHGFIWGFATKKNQYRVTIIFSFFKIILEVNILDLRVQIYFLKYDDDQTGHIIKMTMIRQVTL